MLDHLKDISMNQYLSVFGGLQNLLMECRRPEKGYYVSSVTIEDIPGKNLNKITFDVSYGPVSNDKDSSCDFLECSYEEVFDKYGNYVSRSEKDYDWLGCYYPGKVNTPTVEDFPSTEVYGEEPNELAICLQGIIKECSKCKKPIHKICFFSNLSCISDFNPGMPNTGYDGGEISSYDVEVTGVGLSELMYEGYKYSMSIDKSAEDGEVDIYFKVDAPNKVSRYRVELQ